VEEVMEKPCQTIVAPMAVDIGRSMDGIGDPVGVEGK
jgi:hypothetical protein